MSAAPDFPEQDRAATVRRRHVFYFNGFDPKGAAYYHRLYADGAAEQTKATGEHYQVGRRERTGDRTVQRWQVQWRAGGVASEAGPPVATTYEFLGWDDLVRAHWPKTLPGVAWGSVLAYGAALSSGFALVRVWRQSRRTLVSLAYPAIFWLLALLGGALLGWLAAQLGLFAAARGGVAPAAASTLAWGLGVVVCGGFWWCALWLERKLHTSWLLRIYRFADLWASGKLPDLEERLDAMARRVLQHAQQQDVDEVLLVGYSVGSMLSASVLARVLSLASKGHEPTAVHPEPVEGHKGVVRLGPNCGLPVLSMLTLGQCVPLLGLMPRARAFRQELAQLAKASDLRWTDYSSPGDWGSFALVDPLEICRVVAPGAAALKPTLRSPRFHTLFEANEYAAIKGNKRRLHLQYIMASPKAGAYDYFRMTAGPSRLDTDAHPPTPKKSTS